MIAVYAFVFALVQMGQQRKTKAFLFTAFGWMEWKIFIINGEKDYHEHIVIVLIAAVVLVCAYAFYGRWVAKTWGINPNAQTPAVKYNDGKDYVPPTAGPFSAISFLPLPVQALLPVQSRLQPSAGCRFCCGCSSAAFSLALLPTSALCMLPLRTTASPWAC